MKKPIFAIALLFVFMFTVVSGFSAESEAEEYTTIPATTVSPSSVGTPDEPVSGYACHNCGQAFDNFEDFSNHSDECLADNTKDYVDLTVKELLELYIDIAKSSLGQWDEIESSIIIIIDYIENGNVTEDDIMAAIAELEAYNVPGTEQLLEQLKEKIKNMYAGEVATTVPPITTPLPSTGGGSETPTEPGCNCGGEDSLCDIFSDFFDCVKTFFCRLFNFLIDTFC